MAAAESTNRVLVSAHPSGLRERYEEMVRSAGATGRLVRMPRGGAVHVTEAGEGPPVVHLHGNNTSSLSHLMLLEHTTRVRSFLVDRPGFGLSDPETFPRREFRHHAVRFVTETLDELRLDAAVLTGASGGGTWALWCALDRPERVRGLVMLGSIPLLPGARIPLGIKMVATPGVGDVLTRAVRPGRRMLRRLMSQMGEATPSCGTPSCSRHCLTPPTTRWLRPPTWPSSVPSSRRSARELRPGSAPPTCAVWPCPP